MDRLFLNPAKQKLEDRLSRNSWDILYYLLPQQKRCRYRSEGLISYIKQKDSRDNVEELQVERPNWFLRGWTSSVETAREFGSQWLKGSSSSWVWGWEEVGEGAPLPYPLPEGKGFSTCRWKPWRGRMKQHKWGFLEAGKLMQGPRSCDRAQPWREAQSFHVHCKSLCRTSSSELSARELERPEVLQGNCCHTGTRAHAPRAKLLLTHSPSLLSPAFITFCSLYSGNRITAFAKRFSHRVNHWEARTFQRVILQEQFGNSHQKTLCQETEGSTGWLGSSWVYETSRKTNSSSAICMNEKGLLVLILLFFLFCWLHQNRSLPGGASSFFPC